MSGYVYNATQTGYKVFNQEVMPEFKITDKSIISSQTMPPKTIAIHWLSSCLRHPQHHILQAI